MSERSSGAAAPEAGFPAGFWERVRTAPHRLLLLDYDGTLAPFRADRSEARPLPGVVEALRRIREAGAARLAIVSGRPAAEVLALMRMNGVTVVGCHGYEVRDEAGRWRRYAVPPEEREPLEACYRTARETGYGDRLERKAASVALHTRGLSRSEARRLEGAVRALWEECDAAGRLERRRFAGGLELRARGRHKGTAVAELMGAVPAGTLSVYVGDDETDEDAFRAVRGRGFGFKVGPPGAATAATGRLADPRAVLAFLRRWQGVVSGAARGEGR